VSGLRMVSKAFRTRAQSVEGQQRPTPPDEELGHAPRAVSATLPPPTVTRAPAPLLAITRPASNSVLAKAASPRSAELD
jgi:hypothetical protein